MLPIYRPNTLPFHSRLLGFSDPIEEIFGNTNFNNGPFGNMISPFNTTGTGGFNSFNSPVFPGVFPTSVFQPWNVMPGSFYNPFANMTTDMTTWGLPPMLTDVNKRIVGSGQMQQGQQLVPHQQLGPEHEWLAAYARAPNVDVTEKPTEFLVTVDLPGVRKEDVQLNVSEDRLGRKVVNIIGERKEDNVVQQDPKAGVINRQFYYGRFQRSLRLPETARHEGIQAKIENGVMKIILPKSKEAQMQPKAPQEIRIQ